jgi:hypothetical protein
MQVFSSHPREHIMIIIIGLVILIAAVVAGVAGVLSNGGSGHALIHPFAVFGRRADTETGAPVGARGCRVVGEAAAAVRGTSLAGSDRAYC